MVMMPSRAITTGQASRSSSSRSSGGVKRAKARVMGRGSWRRGPAKARANRGSGGGGLRGVGAGGGHAPLESLVEADPLPRAMGQQHAAHGRGGAGEVHRGAAAGRLAHEALEGRRG